MRWTLLSCLVVISVLTPASKGEFQVNTHTTYDQKNASISMDGEGNFVVVWSSYLQDGSSNGVFGQRFDPNCEPLGDEFQVNSTTAGNQTEPSVAMDDVGNFVVVWHGPGVSEEDVFARRFDSNGQAVGDEFRVNSYTDKRQRYPNVAMNTSSVFVVVWESENDPQDPNRTSICAQIYDLSGSAVGVELTISSDLPTCRYPAVAMDDNGNFAVAWLDQNGRNAIVARLCGADGTPKRYPFQVNNFRFSSITKPSVAIASTGHLVVTWDGDANRASDDDIHARLFRPDGTPIGDQFVANTTRNGAQQYPAVAMNSSQEFVIVWSSRTDPNVNERDIFGRRYDRSCKPVGDEFQINTCVEHDQRYADVVMTETGQCVTVWQSDEQDGSRYGIFGEMVPAVGSADFTEDGFVNFRDFCVLAEEWQRNEDPLRADLTDDKRVDGGDLVAFCEQWLTPYN